MVPKGAAPERAPTDCEPAEVVSGQVIGRYIVESVLGSGGMGTVYAAYDPELDRRIALKLLHRSMRETRLLREGKALARLTHPNIVSVFDVGTFDNRVFLAMELVAGPTLRSWLASARRSRRDILALMLEAGRGLAAAHAAGLVHRDFKPENVLVGRDGRVRVVDFGVTATVNSSEVGATDVELPPGAGAPGGDHASNRRLQTAEKEPGEGGPGEGTPAYMAPEQLFGLPADPRTDQYSFCLTLWEALAGKRIDDRPTRPPGATALHAEPEDRSLPDGPRWMDRILARGLEREPEDRYPSMQALLADIEIGLETEEDRAQLLGGRYQLLAGATALPVPAYRAFDRLSGRVVTLADVTGVNRSASPKTGPRAVTTGMRQVAVPDATPFAGAGAVRADFLLHPHLVSVIARTRANRRTYLVLDLQNPRGLLEDVSTRPLVHRLGWIAQMLRALVFLHQRGIAHGRLRPEWVVLENGSAKLLVPAAEANDERETDGHRGHVGLASAAASAGWAADLAAVGDIAERLLAAPAHGPTHATGRNHLMGRDLGPAEALSAPVHAAIGRLRLAASAGGYANAAAALDELERASGGRLARETPDSRESALQWAPLCGREAEMALLTRGLVDARNGHGSGFLIAGESGIGKSRLAHEICRVAFGSGFEVLRAHAASQGAVPYQLWRDVLRDLCVTEDLDDRDAGVLLSALPDLPLVLGRPIPPAPEVDARSHEIRIVDIITRLLGRRRQPTLLLLEDLQWAEHESLAVLRILSESLPRTPLVLLATGRTDERRDLAAALPAMQLIALGALPLAALKQTATSLVGPAAATAPMLALLERETEGNPFFLVECVRALADRAGSLARIGEVRLPERLFPGGVREAIARRLASVPAAHRRALELAAILGRTVDPEIIGAALPDLPAGAWLRPSLEAQILVHRDGAIRFQHDKIREGLLLGLDASEARSLHRLAAETLERSRPGAREGFSALTHHWGAAGDTRREAHYAARAGEHAIESGALQEGILLLERALALCDTSAAAQHERAHLLRVLGDAYFCLGDFARADLHLESALAMLGYALPKTKGAWTRLAIRMLLRRIPRMWLRRRRPRPESDSDPRLIEASRAAARRAQMGGYRFETIEILALSLLAVELGEDGGRDNAFALGVLGHVAALRGLSRWARRCFDRAHAVAERVGDRPALVGVMLLEAVFLLVTGRIAEAKRLMQEGIVLAEEVGDRVNAAGLDQLRGLADALTGTLTDMRDCYERAANLMRGYSEQHQYTCSAGSALSASLLGRLDEARATAEGSLAHLAPELMLTRVALLTSVTFAHAWNGDANQACEAADAAVACFGSSTAVPPPCLLFLEAPLEAYLAAWRARAQNGRLREAAVLARKVRRLVRGLKGWANWYPIGTAAAHLYEGRYRAARGQHRAARRAFSRALAAAQRLRLPWHQAQAHLEIGKLVGSGPVAERRAHLETARDLFRVTGAGHHVRMAECALDACKS